MGLGGISARPYKKNTVKRENTLSLCIINRFKRSFFATSRKTSCRRAVVSSSIFHDFTPCNFFYRSTCTSDGFFSLLSFRKLRGPLFTLSICVTQHTEMMYVRCLSCNVYQRNCDYAISVNGLRAFHVGRLCVNSISANPSYYYYYYYY